MKKNYFIFVLAILFSGITIAQETQKNFINYQGVARTGADQLMANESIILGIALKMGSAAGPSVYAENHSVTTDANGVFSIKIGNGDAVSGEFNTIPWGSEATFVTVLVNGSEIGSTEMMAVPYALSSGDASQSADEVPYDNAISGLAATNAQQAIDELVGSDAVDADADPTNEIQTISFDPATNEINLTDGGTITIPSGETDADADPTNEFQTLSFDAGTNELSLSDGNVVTIPSGSADADADPTNEIQTISFDAATNEISLTDGGTITIPSGSTDADADPTNELQDITLTGTELSISDGSMIDLAPILPPGGTDDQNLTFNETTNVLEIEDGNTVDLSGLSGGGGSSPWKESGSNIYYNSGNIGLGLTNPQNAWMHIQTNSMVSKPQLLLEEEGNDYARLALKNDQSTAYWHIAGRPNSNADDSKLNFYHHDGTTGRDRMTILGNGNVGIGTADPTAKLDVAGGNWDLSTSEGDFRIGNDSYRLKMSTATGGGGAGNSRIRAQGGANKLLLGAGTEDVMEISPGSVNMVGDFANQGMYQVFPLASDWTPPPIVGSVYHLDFKGAVLTVDVPVGSKAYLNFNTDGLIDSNWIALTLLRDGVAIYGFRQDCYNIAGSREVWHFNLSHLDINVAPGTHIYKISVLHSDDAEDNIWDSLNTSFSAIVLKE